METLTVTAVMVTLVTVLTLARAQSECQLLERDMIHDHGNHERSQSECPCYHHLTSNYSCPQPPTPQVSLFKKSGKNQLEKLEAAKAA